MLICCWSSKGGVGTTVVATALAALLGRSAPGGAVLADLAGDAPLLLGPQLDLPTGAGLAGWLAAGDDAPADALARLEVPVHPGLTLLPRGEGPLAAQRADILAALLSADPRPVVADVGVVADDVGLALAGAATHSLLVLRSCYLALRRACHGRLRPSGVVLVQEEGRAVTSDDVEAALGVPVRATVRVTEQIARAVDAGTLGSHVPRSLVKALRHAA